MDAIGDKQWEIGDYVCKTGGDYVFYGEVTSVFLKKRSNALRYTVENFDGVVHIFSGKQLKPWNPDAVTEAAK